MSLLDRVVTVSISKTTIPIQTDSFDTILILSDNKNTISVKTYTSLVALAEDYNTVSSEYRIANLAFSQKRKPSKIIVGQTQANQLVEGYNAIKSINNDFYAVVCTKKDIPTILAVADAVEVDNKILGCSANDSATIITANGLNGKLRDKNYRRSFCVLANSENEYPEAAIFGAVLSYPAGSITWNFKEISGVAGALLNNADDLKTNKCNYILNFAGRNVFMDGQAINGDFLDTIHGEDKLKNNIQIQIVNALLSNGKIPFNQSGLDIIESVARSAMISSANDGFLDKDSIIVRMPALADISATDKANRLLQNVYLEAKYNGAIHKIGIEVSLTL